MIKRLIGAGLDELYVRFNGDDALVFARGMGRIPFARAALAHTPRAVELARGTRLPARRPWRRWLVRAASSRATGATARPAPRPPGGWRRDPTGGGRAARPHVTGPESFH